jgi:hypothetical protein
LRKVSYLSLMTLQEFQALPEAEQQYALRKAVLLEDREQAGYTIYLFQLDGFYVEVWCHKEDPLLGRYNTFDSLDELAPYLEKIHVSM